MMCGTYERELRESLGVSGFSCVDVSMFFEDGTEAAVVGPELGGKCLTVWPLDSLRNEVSELEGLLLYEVDEDEADLMAEWLRALGSPLNVTRVAGGTLVLTSECIEIMGLRVGGEAVLVGAGEHVELWNRDDWHDEQEDLGDDLFDLMLP